ncbi:hypothetical protein V8D89_000438 [Ganoderma adspersum]
MKGHQMSTILALRSFVHLRRLTLPPIPTYEALRDLVTLPTRPSLRTCEVSVDAFDSAGPISLITCSPSFRTLSLAYPIDTMTWILNHLYAPSLMHFHLTLFGDRTAEDPFDSPAFFTVDHGPDYYNTIPLSRMLAPLLPLSELRGFALRAGACALFTARDADLTALARVWPRLESFELELAAMTQDVDPNPRTRYEADPGCPTVAALHAFHEHCPLLRLAFPFAISAYAPSQVDYPPPPDYTSSHPLRTLTEVGGWAIGREFGEGDAERWARHLLQLFPSLEFGNEEERGRGERWRMVCVAMRQVVRRRGLIA